MKAEALNLVERIIREASRERPADALLRERLKSSGRLSPGDSREISGAVFTYFRWQGWLGQSEPISQQIESALRLAARFARAPEGFSDAELKERAAPGWAAAEMELRAGWARSLQAEPRLWLRARRGQGKALARRIGSCRAFGGGPLADVLAYLGRMDLFRTPEFHAGEFEIQDVSSQAVGFICNPRPGEKWWDACAGEGGKTLHFSDLMENQGLIWASDRAAWRLQRLRRRAGRARVFNYRTAAWDGGPKLPTKAEFDGVLVDAPCSGIGTWQRNPHARWTTNAQDVKELSEAQQRILANAAAGVKEGGKLIYAVCTLARSETIEVAEAFEKQIPGFERLAMRDPLNAEASERDQIWYWPQEFGGNGMFVAGWRRKEG